MKRALITGVSGRLGVCLANEFLKNGYEVWGTGRRPAAAVPSTVTTNEKFRYSVCDHASREENIRLVSEMNAIRYLPEIVVLNAACQENDIKGFLDMEQFRNTIETNLCGVIDLIAQLLPANFHRGSGMFAVISSLSAFRAVNVDNIAYPASKAALNMAIEALRMQYAGQGIRFVTFCPGRMTDGINSLFSITYERAAKKIYRHVHSGRRSDVVCFPWASSLALRASRHVPDFLMRAIVRARKAFISSA